MERQYRVIKAGSIAGKNRMVDDNITMHEDAAKDFVDSGHLELVEVQDRNTTGRKRPLTTEEKLNQKNTR